MRRKVTVFATAAVMALAMAAPAAAHPNSASGKGIGVNAAGELVGQGHYKGIDCNAAEAGKTPFAFLGLCDK